MARDDQQQKQQRRARDDLDKGLKRGDAGLAVAGLMGLPAELRTDALAPVGRLLRKELHALFSRRDWAGLRALAPRFDKEPRLLAAGDDGADASGPTAQVHWALLWAALEQAQQAQAPDAQRRLELLSAAEPLPARLSQALTGLVAGTFTPALLPPGCEDDERLGKEPTTTARTRIPAPTAVADVEPALLQLTALRPFSALATAVRDWLPGSSADVARAVRRLGCELCLRELLLQVRARASLAEPAVLLAELLASAVDDDDVERASLVALRLVTQALPITEINGRKTITERSSAQAFLTLAAAVADRPRQRDMALRLVEGQHFHRELSAVVGPALELLLKASPRVGVWVEAVDLWMLRTPPGTAPPAPLVTALAALVDDGAVAALFSGTADTERINVRRSLLEMSALTMPMALAERCFEQAFSVADENHRVAIGVRVEELAARLRTEVVAPPGGWKSLVQRQAFQELAALGDEDALETDAIIDDAKDRGLTLTQAMELMMLVTQQARGTARAPQATALWDRWSKRLLPLHSRFLARALDEAFAAQTLTFQRAIDLALAHLAGRADVMSWFRALEQLDETEADVLDTPRAGALAETFTALLVDRFHDDVAALARALDLARHAPRALRMLIARGLLAAVERGPVPDSDDVTRGIADARRLMPRKKATTKKATTKKATTKKATKKTKKKAAKKPSTDWLF